MSHQFSTTIKQHGSVPWNPSHMEIGGGYDMVTRESLPSPFDSIDVPDDQDLDFFPQVEVQAQLFRDPKELTNYLESAYAATIPYMSQAAVSAVAACIGSAKCNETNMCLVLRCTISTPPEHFDRQLTLSTAAQEHLRDGLSTFTNCYGEYCVTGQIRQSSFYAVSTYSSESAAELDQFAAALGVTGEAKTINLEVASTLMQRTESHPVSVRESHRFHMTGVEGGGGLSWLEHANVTQAWRGFRDEYKPVPQVALLKHYSSIMPGRVPRPTTHYEVPHDVAEALWKCALLQMAARSVPGHRGTTALQLDRISERLSVLGGSEVAADIVEVRQILAKLEELRDVLRKPTWPDIHAELVKSSCAENQWSHGPLPWESCGEDVWEFGVTPARAEELGIAAKDIATDVKTCILPDTGKLVCQKPDPIRLEVPHRRIIGARLRNRYPDPHEGGKWARVGGWLGGDSFSIKVETRHTRGCHWELTVWSVPQELFETEACT